MSEIPSKTSTVMSSSKDGNLLCNILLPKLQHGCGAVQQLYEAKQLRTEESNNNLTSLNLMDIILDSEEHVTEMQRQLPQGTSREKMLEASALLGFAVENSFEFWKDKELRDQFVIRHLRLLSTKLQEAQQSSIPETLLTEVIQQYIFEPYGKCFNDEKQKSATMLRSKFLEDMGKLPTYLATKAPMDHAHGRENCRGNVGGQSPTKTLKLWNVLRKDAKNYHACIQEWIDDAVQQALETKVLQMDGGQNSITCLCQDFMDRHFRHLPKELVNSYVRSDFATVKRQPSSTQSDVIMPKVMDVDSANSHRLNRHQHTVQSCTGLKLPPIQRHI